MDEPHFKVLEWFRIKGRGWLALVECDRERPRDGSDLKGSIVQIDGERFVVVGIDRDMPAYPIRQGERIGLLVSPKEEGNG